jgi:hypothetical protein
MFLAGKICIETLCLLLDFTGAVKHWDKHMKNDLVWNDVKNKVIKYNKFIECDREKLKEITFKYFNNTME